MENELIHLRQRVQELEAENAKAGAAMHDILSIVPLDSLLGIGGGNPMALVGTLTRKLPTIIRTVQAEGDRYGKSFQTIQEYSSKYGRREIKG